MARRSAPLVLAALGALLPHLFTAAASPARGAPDNCFAAASPACVVTAPRPLPTSEAELLAAQGRAAVQPEGAAALFLSSLLVAVTDEELGHRLLAHTLAPGAREELYGRSGVVPFLLGERSRCVRSFAADSGPWSGYDLDPRALSFRLRRSSGPATADEARLFVCSSGLGNCQPMTLQRDGGGTWRVRRFSSIGCAEAGDPRFPPPSGAAAAANFLGRQDLLPEDKLALQLELGRSCASAAAGPEDAAACVARLHRGLSGGAAALAPASAGVDPLAVDALVALARVLSRRGERGIALLREALAQAEALPPGLPQARARLLVAAAQVEQGSPYAAEALAQRAAQAVAGIGESPRLPAVLLLLGRVQLSLGAAERAEETLGRLVALREARAGEAPIPLAEALTLLAAARGGRGALEPALEALQRALSLYERAAEPAVAGLAQAQLIRGRLLQALGRHGEAEAALLRAVELLRRAGGPLPLAEALGALGDLRRTMGSLGPAARWHREALALEEGALGAEHLRVARRRQALAAVLIATEDLAVARSRLPPGSLLPPGVGSFTPALALLRSSLAAGERQLRALGAGLSEQALARLLAELRDEEELLYSVARGRPQQDEARRLALAAALLRKGRSLDESALSSQAAYRGLAEGERGRMDELRRLRGRLARLAIAGPGGGDPRAYREATTALERRVEVLEEELSRRSAPLRARRAAPGPEAVIERVAQALPPGAALVELAAYRPEDFAADGSRPRRGAPRYLALVLLADGRVQAADLGPAAPVDAAAERLLAGLRRDGGDYLPAAKELHRLVLRPVLALEGVGRRLVLSPDGPLSLVPFEVLHDGARALAEEHELSYVTSGRDLLRGAAEGPPATEVVLLADPAFHGTVAAPRERGLKLGRLAPLPGTREEALALRALLPGAPVRLLLGAEATEPALLAVRAPGVLHVATHGLFVAEAEAPPPRGRGFSIAEAPPPPNPLLRSALVLAGAAAVASAPLGEAGDGADGLATALEVAAMDLWGTQLVVLSACDTGRGEALPGRGVYGLRRAVMAAGAEGLVTSLWKVSDAVTRDLMIAYYRRLLAGAPRPSALREAAQEVRRQHPHPYYWAPFIYLGQAGPLRGLAAARP